MRGIYIMNDIMGMINGFNGFNGLWDLNGNINLNNFINDIPTIFFPMKYSHSSWPHQYLLACGIKMAKQTPISLNHLP